MFYSLFSEQKYIFLFAPCFTVKTICSSSPWQWVEYQTIFSKHSHPQVSNHKHKIQSYQRLNCKQRTDQTERQSKKSNSFLPGVKCWYKPGQSFNRLLVFNNKTTLKWLTCLPTYQKTLVSTDFNHLCWFNTLLNLWGFY